MRIISNKHIYVDFSDLIYNSIYTNTNIFTPQHIKYKMN